MSLTFLLKSIIHEIHFIILKFSKVKFTKPTMAYSEIFLLEEILKIKKPRMCLEWGAGYSTLYFHRFLEQTSSWISIEHDKFWFDKVSKLIDNKKVSIYYIPNGCNYHPSAHDWTPQTDGSYSDFKDYIEFPRTMKQKFDIILIDGRARNECIMESAKLLAENGIVILHDANRQYYHSYFKVYKYRVLFSNPNQNAMGLFFGSNSLDLYRNLDICKHHQNWKILNKGYALYWTITTLLGKNKRHRTLRL